MTDMVRATLRELLGDLEAAWSMGVDGAIAELIRLDNDGGAVADTPTGAQLVTGHGAIALDIADDTRLVAYEKPSRTASLWSHGIAICVDRARATLNARRVFRRLEPDKDAPRRRDRDALLFDLGIGDGRLDAHIRTGDAALIERLAPGLGKPLYSGDNPAAPAIVAAGPHRVFVTRLGRIEVYGPIPKPGTRTPDGPHTHILPHLMGRETPADPSLALPDGLVAPAYAYPPHPLIDAHGNRRAAFDHRMHERFQALWTRFADPARVALKARVMAAVRGGEAPFDPPADEGAAALVRVALRQLAHSDGPSAALAAWRRRLDRNREEK